MKKQVLPPLFTVIMIFLLSLMVISFVFPDKEYSLTENRTLAAYESPALSGVLSGEWMRRMENYTADQFPFRHEFVKINLAKNMLLATQSNGVVHGRNHRLFEQADLLEDTALRSNLASLSLMREKTGLPVYLVVIPEASQVIREELPPFYPLEDSEEHIMSALEQTDGVQAIFMLEALTRRQAIENTFYRTDHHMTWAGADAVYQALSPALAYSPLDTKSFVEKVPDFYGSLHARAPYPFIEPDELSYAMFDNLTMEIEGRVMDGLVDQEYLARPNKYSALLFNNPGMLRLTNTELQTGRWLVIRDSHANAILPSLGQHALQIDAIDPRYLPFDFDLPSLIKREEYGAIICIVGSDTLLTDKNITLLLTKFGH